MIDKSIRPVNEAGVPVEDTSDRESREPSRPRKPALVKPEAQPRKEFVDFYVVEVT
jgi:hypothetical protein